MSAPGKIRVAAFGLAIAGASPAADAPPPIVIATQVEHIDVPHAEVTRLLGRHIGTADAADLRAEVQKLVEGGAARIADFAYLTSNSKQKAQLVSAIEIVHATEFDSAEIPQELEGPITAKHHLIVPPNPTAFEMAHAGNVLALEAELGEDGRLIDHVHWAKLTHLDGKSAWGAYALSMPRFRTMETNCRAGIRDGSTLLLGVLTPSGKVREGFRTMVFCRVDVLDRPLVKVRPGGDGNLPVHVGAEIIEVRPGEVPGLLGMLGKKSDATALRDRVQAFIDSGEASVVGSVQARTQSGRTVRIGAAGELIHPASGDPPETPQELAMPPDPEVNIRTSLSITSFRMREIGMFLEVAPEVSASTRSVEAEVIVERVASPKETTQGEGGGKKRLPVFDVVRIDTTSFSRLGDDRLLAVAVPRDVASGAPLLDRRWLVFMNIALAE